MPGQAGLTLHYMVSSGGSNRPLWWIPVARLQGHPDWSHYWPVTVCEEAVLSILAVCEAGSPWGGWGPGGPGGPGGQYTRLLLFVTQRPLSPSAFRSISSFPSEIKNISVSQTFLSVAATFYVSSRQTAGLLCSWQLKVISVIFTAVSVVILSSVRNCQLLLNGTWGRSSVMLSIMKTKPTSHLTPG